jgi:hypothetical protein
MTDSIPGKGNFFLPMQIIVWGQSPSWENISCSAIYEIPHNFILSESSLPYSQKPANFVSYIIWWYCISWMSRDSSVGVATSYGPDGRGSIPGRGKIFFFTPQLPDRISGTPSLLANGYRGDIFQGLRRPGREADQSSPSSVEVKNGGAMLALHHTPSWRGA